MTAEVTYEQRVIRVDVTNVPDIPNQNGAVMLVPYAVEITYTRDSRYATNNGAGVVVTGARRLKSGAVGNAEQSVRWWRGQQQPDWVAALVETYSPTDWLVEGEARS